MTKRVVGVFPGPELAQRARLFAALGAAFDVTFEAREAGATDLVGAILFPGGGACGSEVIPTFRITGPAERRGAGEVRFADESLMDPVLRGRTLMESRAPAGSLAAEPGDIVLATCDGRPAWLTHPAGRGWHHSVALAPDEVARGATLGDQLMPGRFLGLLALIEYMRGLDPGWSLPALRAAFIFDDPNLHAQTYGHIDYPRLAADARRFGYHAVMASIPRDFGFAAQAAVDVFKREREFLSITVHGNDHLSEELLRSRPEAQSLALAAQSLTRTSRFERRTGLKVSRVMCAPHEVCSEETMRALFRTGFDGLAIEQVQLRAALPEPDPVLGILPADRVCNGLPVLPRLHLDASEDDLVLSAYLRRPMLPFGHHWDLATGYERLADTAAFINGLGDVHWGPLSEACRESYAWHLQGASLSIRLYGRAASIRSGDAVSRVVLTIPGWPEKEGFEVAIGGGSRQPLNTREKHEIIPSGPAECPQELEIWPRDAVDPASVTAPPWRPWAAIRRTATELRDRVSGISVGQA